ncbi:signal transduction protein [Paramagnetospirillum marisnigri]|uniref:Signal transduction protein n=1 Tax=Paramagnetospirillum marisnigri TaxID=1285242 RepID=A0A178MVT0_9PROT|nr:EAL domain-containing protein [Paramagnetospirillum marisnigri]OAN53147.1 signal transduction protein [Paramagnetospirillum marisnigri]
MLSKEVACGDRIFSEGDAADCAYLIEQGQVEIAVERDGHPQVLALLGPGEVFGEMGVIDGLPRSAGARAVSQARLIQVSAEQIQQVVARSDPFFAELMRKLVGRLRDTQASLMAGGDGIGSHSSDFGPGYAALMRERDIAEAIISGEIEPFLQPIIDLDDKTVLGYETLARWRSDRLGLMRPHDFLPLARRTGLIRRIDLTMADRAMAICARLGDQETSPFVSINVSGWLIQDRTLPATLERMTRQHGVAPSRICLEVTETMLIDDMDAAEQAMDELHDLGLRIALDDFGTGLSSLSVLHRLPFDLIKVDGSLIQGCQTSARQRAVLSGILDLCGRLDMEVIAEGIEEAGTARTLHDLGFPMGQGQYFAPPAQATKSLSAWREDAL